MEIMFKNLKLANYFQSAFIQSLQHSRAFQTFQPSKQQQQQSTTLLPNIKSQLLAPASHSCFFTVHQLQLLLNSSSPNKQTLRPVSTMFCSCPFRP
jgi:hypothetical protein